MDSKSGVRKKARVLNQNELAPISDGPALNTAQAHNPMQAPKPVLRWACSGLLHKHTTLAQSLHNLALQKVNQTNFLVHFQR